MKKIILLGLLLAVGCAAEAKATRQGDGRPYRSRRVTHRETPSLPVMYPIVSPPYVGYTEMPPANWGEVGNQGRSVRFTNDWNPYNRYYLRIFLDGEELVFTDGVGVFQTMILTARGMKPASLLRPYGQSMHMVDVGEHHLLVERYVGPEPAQYKDTCEWRIDFDGNLGTFGEWHFWGGVCSKSAPSS
jgi:hypothetical protein